jgi:hypothetical protein
MADDDRRVVPKPMVVAGGMTATPEGIAELERRRIQSERLSRPPPTKSFSAMLRTGRAEAAAEPEPSSKEKKRAALPRQGPRPALAHPSQRDTFGRGDDSDETVVLKG